MSIEEAKEEFDFFNEGDYITREMSIAKDIVIKKLHETESDLYEANNRIADLFLILGDRDRMIDLMVEHIYTGCDFDNNIKTKEQIREYFEERCNNAENKS